VLLFGARRSGNYDCRVFTNDFHYTFITAPSAIIYWYPAVPGSVTLDCCFAVFEQWEAEHGPRSTWELIEPVDGFHPNQVCTFSQLVALN